MALNFQVADVRNPLLAVKRITENGNSVCFGPDAEDNYILNKRTRERIPMVERQGSYIMEVQFVGGGATEIVVDSGAEESVCPRDWGEKLFGTDASPSKVKFRGAGGDIIQHHGQREVLVVSSPF